MPKENKNKQRERILLKCRVMLTAMVALENKVIEIKELEKLYQKSYEKCEAIADRKLADRILSVALMCSSIRRGRNSLNEWINDWYYHYLEFGGKPEEVEGLTPIVEKMGLAIKSKKK
jgi:hypothetical protein